MNKGDNLVNNVRVYHKDLESLIPDNFISFIIFGMDSILVK